MPGMTGSKCWAGAVKSSGGKETRKHRGATVQAAIGMAVSNQTKGTGQDRAFPQQPIFTEILSANSKRNVAFPRAWPCSFSKGDKFTPAFASLPRGLNLALRIQTMPLISFVPFSHEPPADAPAPFPRVCSRGAFLSVNHAAEIRFPSDKSPAQSARKGGESICLIAVDPSFCTPQGPCQAEQRGSLHSVAPSRCHYGMGKCNSRAGEKRAWLQAEHPLTLLLR